MARTLAYGSLRIAYDERVLAPRPWTVLQAEWAADLLADAPDGPALELCAADPPEAIDGGPDGLDVARACLRVASPHLLPGGTILLQLGTREQAAILAAEVVDLAVGEVREGEDGVVARLRRAGQA